METGQDSISGSVEPMCRPVCIETEFPTSSLHQLVAEPTGNGISSELEKPPGLCLPPLCPNRQMLTEDTSGWVNSGIDSPSVAILIVDFKKFLQ